MNVQESSFSGMAFTVGKLVRIRKFARSKVICEAGFSNIVHNLDKRGGFETEQYSCRADLCLRRIS